MSSTPLRVPPRRVLTAGTKRLDVCVEWRRSLGALGIEPGTGWMGFEVRFGVKNGRSCEAKGC
jgi:hypothetical protein